MPSALRRFFVAISVAAICAVLAGPALAADPDKKPDGFRGIAWGNEVSGLADMALVEQDGDFADYDRKNDKMDLGGMPVAVVTYGFYKGRFYHAAINYEGTTGYDAVQEQLVAKYGKPDVMTERADDAGRAYVLAAWNWPGHAYIGHRRYKDGTAGRLFYFYSPLVEASKAAAASAVATAAMAPKAPATEKAASTSRTPAPKPAPNLHAGTPEPREDAARAVPEPEAPQARVAPDVSEKAASGSGDGTGTTHVIVKGDMLSALAKRYGVPREAILAANPGITPTNLKLGQTLRIPGKGEAKAEAAIPAPAAKAVPEADGAPESPKPVVQAGPEKAMVPETAQAPSPGPSAAAPGTHVIVAGDMISAIAKHYGVSEKAILKANPGLKPGNLQLGQIIRLPAGAKAQETPATGPAEPRVEAAPKAEPRPEPAAEVPAPPVQEAKTDESAASKAVAVQSAKPREHVLEFEDTLSGLAKRYGVTTAAIMKANPGLDPKKLKPGKKIKIP
ncbi:MAG: LysM peptidoglycan-binding domain-containing protein [Desulfovibrio sp.]|nr:LysM peptidoglycan-binding domain-containing protein [Desulfovibrio sp.]